MARSTEAKDTLQQATRMCAEGHEATRAFVNFGAAQFWLPDAQWGGDGTPAAAAMHPILLEVDGSQKNEDLDEAVMCWEVSWNGVWLWGGGRPRIWSVSLALTSAGVPTPHTGTAQDHRRPHRTDL